MAYAQTLSIRLITLLFLGSFLGACASVKAPPTPTEAQPSPTPEPSPTPTPLPPGILVEPILTAPMIFPHSFSPDDTFLAYWTFTKEELEEYVHPIAPPGTLHFLNIHTREVCEPPLNVESGGWQNVAWLPNERVMLFAEGRLLEGKPCSQDFSDISNLFPVAIMGIASVRPDGLMFLLHSLEGYLLYEPESQEIRQVDGSVSGWRAGYSWSPEGSRLGISAEIPGAEPVPIIKAATWIVNTQTGEVEDFIQWRHPGGEGNLAGPDWISEEQFLIQRTVDRGPLLVTVGEKVIRVGPELFAKDEIVKCEECATNTSLVATGAPVAGEAIYHIALSGLGRESNNPRILIYHSEDGQIEELPKENMAGFSPDGRMVFFYNNWYDPKVARDTYQLSVWWLDIPGANTHEFWTTHKIPLPLTFSPDGEKVAVGGEWVKPDFTTEGAFSVFALKTGAELSLWSTGRYNPSPFAWSPDGKLLVVRGTGPSSAGGHWKGGEALFILEIP